jgi:hypothetical protein
MNTRLLLLFIFSPVFVFSQTKITGKVIDKETQKPVSDVIVHLSSKISITNGKGEFDIDIGQSEVIYFRHLSYNLFKIQSDSLRNNDTVYLVPNVAELNEIVIFPDYAKYLLNKAVNNLFANFQEEKTERYYMAHIEGNTTKGDIRNAYALFESILNKVDVKNNSFKWALNLVQIDRINGMNKDDFKIKNIINIAQFFPVHYIFPTFKDNNAYTYDIYEDNKEEVIVRVSPQYLDKKHYMYSLYTIQKQDTILTNIIAQSYSNSDELTAKKFRKVKLHTSNHFYVLEFANNTSGIYNLDKIQHFVNTKITLDTVIYNITNKILTYSVKDVSDDIEKKRIKSHDYDLSISKFPDSPGFWKKYVNPE